MADNYLEKKREEYQARKAAAEKARQRAWKKRLDAYRKRLAADAAAPEVAHPASRPAEESDN